MVLNYGITGFYRDKDRRIPPTDPYWFQKLCFTILLQSKGKIFDFDGSLQAKNFYCAACQLEGEVFHILLNAYYPYLAFALSVGFGTTVFIDKSSLNDKFSPDYQVLSQAELDTPLALSMQKNELNKAELRQIKFWKPNSIGQVIFNYWD